MEIMGTDIHEITTSAPAWPDHHRLALCLTFNFESGEAAPTNPGGFPNYLYMTTHQFGARRGIWNLLEVLSNAEIRATFFVSGLTAERYPEAVRGIYERGHDIGGFTYACESVWGLSEREEREILKRSISALQKVTGSGPIGWRCPDFKISKSTLRLVADLGLQWDSNLLNDDLPYVLQLDGHQIVEVPPSMATYDKHFLYLPNPRGSAEDLFEVWLDEFEVLYQESALQPKLMTLSCHPFLIARPAHLAKLEAFLGVALSRPGVWAATCSQIAHWWMNLCHR